MGCVGFRGNNRLLLATGLLVLVCYLMSELVLRSWTLEDADAQWTRDCLDMRGMNPSLPETPCRHEHLGVEVEKRGQVKGMKPGGRDAPVKGSRRRREGGELPATNNFEIDVDSADLQPRNLLRNRPAVHRRGSSRTIVGRGVGHMVRTPSMAVVRTSRLRDAAVAADIRSRGGGSRGGQQRQSIWTLWEGSKNSSHLQFLSSDVLQYRNAMQERMRQSTESPELLALERKFYSRDPKRINPHDFSVLYNASGVCGADQPFLVVVIPSLPSSRDRRNAIRDTWGSVARLDTWPNEQLKAKVRIAFLLGRTESFHVRQVIKQEYEQYGDIVQEDFLESYRNLSLKTVMGIKWVLNHCSGARYVMKCDDDMIAHIPMVLKLLTENKYQNAIIGHINKGAVVQRQGLWGLSPEEFPFDRFPPYASGTAYILSGDLIKPIFQMSEHVALVPIEDAYISGVLNRIVGGTLVHRNGFTSWNSFSPRTCDLILGRIFTGTKMTSNSLRRMWQRIKSGGPNCNRDAPNIVMARMSRNE